MIVERMSLNASLRSLATPVSISWFRTGATTKERQKRATRRGISQFIYRREMITRDEEKRRRMDRALEAAARADPFVLRYEDRRVRLLPSPPDGL